MTFAAGSQNHSYTGSPAETPNPTCFSSRPRKSVVAILLVAVFLSQLVAGPLSSVTPEAPEDERTARIAAITKSLVISPTTARVGEEVTFFANASSDVASSLNFTIYYDYTYANGTLNPFSPVSTNLTGNPGAVVTKFTYGSPGNLSGGVYSVALVVFDGFSSTRSVKAVTILPGNSAPYFAPPLAAGYAVDLDVPVEFSVTVFDIDDDALTLTWDFGDGTAPVIEETGPAAAGVVCAQTHIWSPPPELLYGVGDGWINYDLVLLLEDGAGGSVSTTSLINITLPHNFSPRGTLVSSVGDSSKVDPADVVYFNATATDAEGEPLTWTLLFNDGTEVFRTEVIETGLTDPNTVLYVNLTHTFSVPGNYSVTLYLTDVSAPEDEIEALVILRDGYFDSHNVSVCSLSFSSIANRAPVVLADITVSPQDVYFDEESGTAVVSFRIQASDADGDMLTAVWDFGDSSAQQANSSYGSPGPVYTFIQLHVFYITGPFNVSVTVTDGRPGHEVLRYKLVNVTSNNSAPEVRDFRVLLSNSSYAVPGSVVQFVLVIFDLERDPVTIVWDFGDGSPRYWTNVTAYDVAGNATCFANHSYALVGKYSVLINFTDNIFGRDGYHNESWTGFVTVDIASTIAVRIWNWWDYASLSLFVLTCALLCVWAMSGTIKRSRLDRQGMTVEEYAIRKQLEDDAHKRKGLGGF